MNTLREKCYTLICDKLMNHEDEYTREEDFEEFVEQVAFDLEKGLFDSFSDSTDYRREFRKIYSNVTSTPNAPMVRRRLFDGTWKALEIAKMTAKELYPEREEEARKVEDTERELTAKFEKMKMDKVSMYTCKCGSQKTEHTQVQTRSADEGYTIKVVCLECGNRWNM
jgi:DNA-directed RNA polymerase subunit M/transcription elongation factor TFIIS